MSKKFVAYFSASGVTAGVANNLAAAVEADCYEIRPAQPYTRLDLNWTDKQSRTTLESKNPALHPESVDENAPVAEAEIIYLGFPMWWYVAPQIVHSFLESYNFHGKTIVVFATSGSSVLAELWISSGQALQM